MSSIVLTDSHEGRTTASVVSPGLIDPKVAADLERYLNVTRAEILFAREVVFVEGAADAYLLPALAEAAGFHFDNYGIVVSNVEGTDFAPYATLLGPTALNRPHWVLTDGDAANAEPTSRGVKRTWLKEPGLWRAKQLAELAGMSDLKSDLVTGIDAITEVDLPETGSRPDRPTLVETARRARVYVGEHTLEVDIAHLLSEELAAAHGDFKTRNSSRRAFEELLKPVASGDASTAQERSDFVEKIEDIGKGRFAQRLAAHVAVMDLRARLRDFYPQNTDGAFTRGELASIQGAGSILVLLEDLSQAVRGVPLLPALAPADGAADDTGQAK
ncbi:TOPRIM nucleotidyl transferase/hydrolase domain-containing protein [Kitasatospora sp. NPDC001603]|uniref:ATP-dependent nuclease n=1 Tax=Kitasatospora sp. NPDC001603 TaxID=3154388 RepID=UPI00331D63C1